jgi:hypothetical protein
LQALTTVQLYIPSDAVTLWQPKGLLSPSPYSKPKLYNVSVCFQAGSSNNRPDKWQDSTGRHSHSKEEAVQAHCQPCGGPDSSTVNKRIGFRSVELVRRPMSEASFELQSPPAVDPQQQQEVLHPPAKKNNSSSTSQLDPAFMVAPGLQVLIGQEGIEHGKLATHEAVVGPEAADTMWPEQLQHKSFSKTVAAVQAAVKAVCLANFTVNITAQSSSTSGSTAANIAQQRAGAGEEALQRFVHSTTAQDRRSTSGSSSSSSLSAAVAPSPAAAAVVGDSLNIQQEFAEKACSAAAATAAARYDAMQHHHLHLQERQREVRPAEFAATTATGGAAADPQDGESFYFRVNDVPLYVKGANLIPLHILSTAVSAEDVVLLLHSAAAAGMNMIRIWGGGLYQVGLTDSKLISLTPNLLQQHSSKCFSLTDCRQKCFAGIHASKPYPILPALLYDQSCGG